MTKTSRILALVALACLFLLTPSGLWPAQDEAPAARAAGEGATPAEVAAQGEGGHGEAAVTGYTAERWRDFLWRLMNFVVYVGLLWILLRKPAAKFLSGRREGIARTLEYLETQSRNLDEQTRVMGRQLDQLGQERLAILSQYERDGAKERDRIVSDAHKTAEVIIRRAEAAMELEIKTARQSLTAEVGRLAADLARRQLTERITDDDRGRLVLEFVDKVIKLPARNL
jgi:F-type H+-transporting ATPase subunit b